MISQLQKADEGTYVITYNTNGEVKGSNNVILEVIEAIRAVGDVYDYATVQGFKNFERQRNNSIHQNFGLNHIVIVILWDWVYQGRINGHRLNFKG